MQVFGGKALLEQHLDHALEAALGDGLVVLGGAGRAGLGDDGEPGALDAAGKGTQTVGLFTAQGRAVVRKLHIVSRLLDSALAAALAVIELSLQARLVLLCPLSQIGFAVGACLGIGCFLSQGVVAVVERAHLVAVEVAQLACAALHEVVAHGGEGVDVVLGGDVLPVEQPVHLALHAQGEASAHIGLDV